MPRYEVRSIYPLLVSVTIEADTPEEACSAATEIFVDEVKQRRSYDYEATEVDE